MKTNLRQVRVHDAMSSLFTIAVATVMLLAGAAEARMQSAQAPAVPNRHTRVKVGARAEPPAIIAVRIHHGMCPFCRKLDPMFTKLSRQTKEPTVLFVTLDLSDKASQRQAALLAGALGLESLWTGDFSNIGTVTFVDGKRKRKLSTFSAMDPQTMQPAPAKQLDAALREAVRLLSLK